MIFEATKKCPTLTKSLISYYMLWIMQHAISVVDHCIDIDDLDECETCGVRKHEFAGEESLWFVS